MSDVSKSDDIPLLLGPPMPLAEAMSEAMPELMLFRPPQIHNHGPGEYCFFCPCHDCCKFYGRGVANRCVEPMEPTEPRYGDMGLVNSMRAAAAKREEDRQEKLSAEREGTAGAAEALKRDKPSRDQAKKKTVRSSVKRRRV